jgi:twitching motility protein PilT
MAAFDSLLRVMTLRDADAMIVVAGQPPALRRSGNAEALAMPAMTGAMVDAFVDEVAGAAARADLASRGAAEVVYRAADGGRYGVMIERLQVGCRMVVRRTAAVTTAAKPAEIAATGVVARSDLGVGSEVSPVAVVAAAGGAGAAYAPARIASAIATAATCRASDVLVSEGQPLRLRLHGEIVELGAIELRRGGANDGGDGGGAGDYQPITADEVLGLLDDGARRALDEGGSVDRAATMAGARVRINAFRHHGGVAATLRLIRATPPSWRDLGLPEDLGGAVAHRSGLVLVAGQAGSGKSTTLVALVDHLNRNRAAHIVTLEEPIEYEHAARRSLIHQREIGVHAASFADGLRAALRESPDVIVVGELRDRETIAIALTAAETGHLVLGTVHAAGAAGVVDRIVDVFPDGQQRQIRTQLAASLRVIITQHLLPRARGGRVPAIERVVVTPAIAHLIRKNETHMFGAHVQAGRDLGMLPLERSLAALARAGTVDAATARALAIDVDMFEQALRGR